MPDSPATRPRDMEFYTLYAALRHAIVMLRIAYRQAHFGEVAIPADPDSLILHHGSLAPWCRAATGEPERGRLRRR